MTAIITRSGVFIEEQHFISRGHITKLKTRYTVSNIGIKDMIKRQSLFKFVNTGETKYVILPRAAGIATVTTCIEKYCNYPLHITNQITSGDSALHQFKRSGQCRGNQQLIHNHIMENYFNTENVAAGNAGVILKQTTGQGKSYAAMALMATLNVKTLIICHSTAVANDWVMKNLKTEFPKTTVGQYNGKTKTDGDVVVAIINSLLLDNLKINGEVVSVEHFFKRFGFVVYDETQKYNSKEFSKIFWRAQAPYVLGLSATPENHEFYKMSFWGIGPVLDSKTIPGYVEREGNFTSCVHMIKYWAPPSYSRLIINDKLKVTNTAATINMITDDPHRNQSIVNSIIELVYMGLNIFVFSDRKRHLKSMSDILQRDFASAIRKIKLYLLTKTGANHISDYIMEFVGLHCDISILTGGSVTPKVKAQQMEHAENKSNVIFTIYSYMDTGKSIPKMNAIVLSTPRKTNSEQSIGRILRMGPGEEVVRRIVDFVDWNTVFKSQWYVRKKYYDGKKYTIEKKEVDKRAVTDSETAALLQIPNVVSAEDTSHKTDTAHPPMWDDLFSQMVAEMDQ